MLTDTLKKYQPYHPVDLPDRKWPQNRITSAPVWCSVDLRDGNQALIVPMNIQEKSEMFRLLVNLGFKEIEVGFPAAAEVEYEFVRHLIENDLIPEDVTIQVLTQAREHLIRRTAEALRGARKAVIHLYNSTSTLQRAVVFRMGRNEIRDLAVEGVRIVKSVIQDLDTRIILEYSPESFTGTEPEFAVEVCDAVMNAWQPDPGNKMILNLPATVEMSMPNIYADQIEYFIRNLPGRQSAVVSLHTHNDRGTGVAATELGLLAGADRVEGTLFGNGERTGNVDIVTLALNMYSQGIDPHLDFSNAARVVETYERCTRMSVHQRHPYVGDLVYTAFSGSHQDAINKGLAVYREKGGAWAVPYLPIDPADIGRTYDSIIRINSQSGKGGVAYVMETEFGYTMPKTMHPEFARVVQEIAERAGGELQPGDILAAFENTYLKAETPVRLKSFQSQALDEEGNRVSASMEVVLLQDGEETTKIWTGSGNGPIDAAHAALQAGLQTEFRILNFAEHSLRAGSDAAAVAYLQLGHSEHTAYGAGVHGNTQRAAVKALISAVNRLVSRR